MFFNDKICVRLHKDQRKKMQEIRKKCPQIFKNDADIVRISINYYYNMKYMRGELDEFEIDG